MNHQSNLFFSFLYLIVLSLLCSCSKDNPEPDNEDGSYRMTKYDGVYEGAFYEGDLKTSSWLILIKNGKIYSVSTGIDDEVFFSGKVDKNGNISGNITADGNVKVGQSLKITIDNSSVEGTITTTMVSGTWTDNGASGTFSGQPVIDGIKGGYTGEAYQNGKKTGSWVAVIFNGKVYGVSTGEDNEILINGTLDEEGNLTGTGEGVYDGLPYSITISGNVNSDVINGNWSDGEDSGTFNGEKIYSDVNQVRAFDGGYSGNAYQGQIETSTWLALIYNGFIYGISTGEDGETIIEGTVDVKGEVEATGKIEENGENYVTQVEGTISGESIYGTWSDDESSGVFAGGKTAESYNGGYSGDAFQGEDKTGTWKVVIYDGLIYGVSTGVDNEIIIEGTVDLNGNISGTGEGQFDGEPYNITLNGSVSGNIIEGTWSDGVDSGSFSGIRL